MLDQAGPVGMLVDLHGRSLGSMCLSCRQWQLVTDKEITVPFAAVAELATDTLWLVPAFSNHFRTGVD